MEELLSTTGKKFNITAKRIFTQEGGEVDNVELIRYDELHLSFVSFCSAMTSKMWSGLCVSVITRLTISLCRDNDILYVSEREPFKKIVDLSAKSQPSPNVRSLSEEWITLNVGGKRFVTSRSTLIMKEPNSMLAK